MTHNHAMSSVVINKRIGFTANPQMLNIGLISSGNPFGYDGGAY